jgi:two-component system, OmpR family, KDP operon response regulator KdpE
LIILAALLHAYGMGKNVLIIDDESDIRFLLKRSLIAHNYTVQEAESLKKGVELFSHYTSDIVILDVNLPDGNGIDYVGQFKTSDNLLLLMSADNDQLTERYRDYGADGFLRKPFNMTDLLSVIQKMPENS